MQMISHKNGKIREKKNYWKLLSNIFKLRIIDQSFLRFTRRVTTQVTSTFHMFVLHHDHPADYIWWSCAPPWFRYLIFWHVWRIHQLSASSSLISFRKFINIQTVLLRSSNQSEHWGLNLLPLTHQNASRISSHRIWYPIFLKSILPSPYWRWQWLTTHDETWKKKVLHFGRITRNVISEVATYAERLETGLQRHRTNKCKADVRISISISLNRLMFPTKWRKSPSRIGLSGWVWCNIIFEACHQWDFCICTGERIMWLFVVEWMGIFNALPIRILFEYGRTCHVSVCGKTDEGFWMIQHVADGRRS